MSFLCLCGYPWFPLQFKDIKVRLSHDSKAGFTLQLLMCISDLLPVVATFKSDPHLH